MPPARARRPFHRRLALTSALTAFVCCAGLQGGCVAGQGAGTAGASNKTPIDQAFSWVSGKDCAMARHRHGYTYCVEDELVPQVQVHCYPTLGEVTCYAAPDPFPGGQRKLGSLPPVLAARQARTPPDVPAALPSTPVTPETGALIDGADADAEGPSQ